MRTYRASSLGSCTRAQIAAQLGMAPVGTPEKLQAIYDRGVDHEAECLAAMEADGWSLLEPAHRADVRLAGVGTDEGQFYVKLPVAGAVVTGHLDSLGSPPMVDIREGRRVIEIKSPASWAKWERAHKTSDYSDPLMNRYAWQISVYMAATGLEAVVACVEDGQVRTFGIEVAPYSLEQIAERVNLMESLCEIGVPDICDSDDGWSCPFRYLCGEKREVVEDEALDVYLAEYAKYDAQEKFAKDAKAELRKAVDAHLGLADSLTTEAGTATRVAPSTVTDWKATAYSMAEAAGIDLDNDGVQVRKARAGFVKITPRDSEPS